jgi:ADP-heptose:LPS heptosyltransferase
MIVLALHSSGETQGGPTSLWRSYPYEAQLQQLIPDCVIVGSSDRNTWAKDLPSLVALLESAEAVIATDNGILALAIALGKSTVAIFGPTDHVVIAEQFAEYGDISKLVIVRSDASDEACCRPCNFQYERGFERAGKCAKGRADCIEEITPEQVAAALKSVL